MSEIDITLEIARLVRFGLERGLLEELDMIQATNALLDLFGAAEPYVGELPTESPDSPVPILERLLDYAAEHGLLAPNTTTFRDLLDAKIMGHLMPRESEAARSFWLKAKQETVERATDWFYRMSIDSNYIRMDRIRKNLYWHAPTEYGELEITINLSKPEKDPRDIAAERSMPQSRYPKCLLCLENVGYAGRVNHPARQNHRVIPLALAGERWFFQYSPYVYYNEHCIILSEQHRPMQISRHTFERLLEFIGQFGHYFIGSNADLPIVGGSILSHDHFQGGRHRFPMEKAPVERRFIHNEFPDVKAGIVKWPLSAVRLSCREEAPLIELAERMLTAWRAYSDSSADILAASVMERQTKPHNTITPIARRNAAGEFELDLVLRNNRTTAEHPLGLFHPHADLHHIKKENIGLIEVMGLAVLPGRLREELEQIAGLLTGEQAGLAAEAAQTEHPLHQHAQWLRELQENYGTGLSKDEAMQCVQTEAGRKFARVLEDCGVFKRNAEGQAAFDRFLRQLGYTAVCARQLI